MRKVPPLLLHRQKSPGFPLDNDGKNRYHHRARSFSPHSMDTKDRQRHTPLPLEAGVGLFLRSFMFSRWERRRLWSCC